MNETSRFQEMLRVARRRRRQPGRLKCNITHGARPARGLPMSLIPEGRGRAKGNRTYLPLHFSRQGILVRSREEVESAIVLAPCPRSSAFPRPWRPPSYPRSWPSLPARLAPSLQRAFSRQMASWKALRSYFGDPVQHFRSDGEAAPADQRLRAARHPAVDDPEG